MKRRFWAGLLFFVMLWSLLPASALAADIPSEYRPTIEWWKIGSEHTIDVTLFYENVEQGTIQSKGKGTMPKVTVPSGIEVYESETSSRCTYALNIFTFLNRSDKSGILKLYTRSTAGHKVTVKYVFDDASGKTRADAEKAVKYLDSADFEIVQDNYEYTAAVTKGDATFKITGLTDLTKRLEVTGGTQDSEITVTYTPKDHVIYIDPYYDKGGILAKWNGENIRVNGPELVNNNALAEESVVRNSDLTAKMEEYRFLTVNDATYDFSYARAIPSVRDDPITVTDVWYDREDGMWYYSYTGREGIGKIPLVNEGGINFCYNTKHSESSAHHQLTSGETVAPACTKGGYTVYKCAYCDYTEQRDQTAFGTHVERLDAR